VLGAKQLGPPGDLRLDDGACDRDPSAARRFISPISCALRVPKVSSKYHLIVNTRSRMTLQIWNLNSLKKLSNSRFFCSAMLGIHMPLVERFLGFKFDDGHPGALAATNNFAPG
jgi:hypothetical protein